MKLCSTSLDTIFIVFCTFVINFLHTIKLYWDNIELHTEKL